MREYQCHTKCFNGSLWRPGDIATAEEKIFEKHKDGEKKGQYKDPLAGFLENHFALISRKGKGAMSDPEAGVKAFMKKHKMSDEIAESVFEKAKAVEPHEKLAALNAYIDGSSQE